MTAIPKNKPIRNKKYLAFVREQPCCACGLLLDNQAHHFGRTGKGIGVKASDYEVVSLCPKCHWECGDLGNKKFQAKYNVNFDMIAGCCLVKAAGQ